MQELVKVLCRPAGSNEIDWLVALIDHLRPRRPGRVETAERSLRALSLHLRHHPEVKAALSGHLMRWLARQRQVQWFAEAGILENTGFFSTLWSRAGARLLPEERRVESLRDDLAEGFHQRDDHAWLRAISESAWREFFEILQVDAPSWAEAHSHLRDELLESAEVLSIRLAALGVDPELIRVHPILERHASPFLAQQAEVHAYRAALLAALPSRAAPPDDRHIHVLLDQCAEVLAQVRKNSHETGASIHLTYRLQRAAQMIARLRRLFMLVDPARSSQRFTAGLALFLDLVEAENRRHSLGDVVRRTTDLVALQVTENASKTGEHYAAATREEYFAMARSAGGAGLIVGAMALVKILAAKLALAPIGQALVYSLNYSLGFMLVHVLHFTIATKQPAMTAATIAATIEEATEDRKAPLNDLVELIAVVLRTQWVAILGNVLVAFPTALLIAGILAYGLDANPVTPDKADHLLHDLDPFASLALLHAAIAGVCLFFAGLISGYYDNACLYGRIPQRVCQLRWLGTLLGAARRARLADYLERNLGALAGNAFFGIMLGSMGTLGWILGLPIDIRHVTFSAANLAYALVGLEFHIGWGALLTALAGVLMIGCVNLLVSFGLALHVALKSRRVRFDRGGELAGLLWRRFYTRPRDFFLPPRQRCDPPVRDQITRATSP